jgi:hypothetical protein
MPLKEQEFFTRTISEESSPYTDKQATRRFLVQKRIRVGNTPIPDTIQVGGWENYEGLGQHRWDGDYTTYTIDTFEVYVFFGNYRVKDTYYPPNTFYPCLSGVRPFFKDTMYLPIQPTNPGPFSFYRGDTISLYDFVQETYYTMARIDSLLSLRQIKPAAAQNQALFNWIEKHLEGLKTSIPLFLGLTGDRRNNWGTIKWEVFDWIDENGVWQDSWKGIEISPRIREDGHHCYRLRWSDESAFANPEARAFLRDRIQDTLLQEDVRDCALEILGMSLWAKKSNKWEAQTLGIREDERQVIIQTVMTLLDSKNQYRRGSALEIIEQVAFPKYKELVDFYDEATLAQLKTALERETEGNNRTLLRRLIEKMQQAKK